jgi:hypothetical protein
MSGGIIMPIQSTQEDDQALEEEIVQEILRDFGASGSQVLEFFGGPGFVERVLTSK